MTPIIRSTLGPRLIDGVPQVSGQCATVAGNTDAAFTRLIELHFAEPSSGIIIVTTSQPGLDWVTRLKMGSGLGGPVLTQTWHQARVALSWAGQDIELEVREGQSFAGGTRFCATAGLEGANADQTFAFDSSGSTPAEAVRIQDGALNNFFASVNQNTGLGSGALAAVGATVGTGVPAALFTGPTRGVIVDDNGAQAVQPCVRQNRTRGVINQNAFAAGGTATLIGAPGANLATALTSVQLGPPSATTVVTLESPAGTVLWASNVLTAITPPVIGHMPTPLTGATNGAWVVRSSAIATFSVNAQGFTERVA